jgi:hypothetical protein
MPYTIDSPAIDLRRDPQAKAIVDRYLPGTLDLPFVQVSLVTMGTVTQNALFAAEIPDDLDDMWEELAAVRSSSSRRGPQPAPLAAAPADVPLAGSPAPQVSWIGPAEQWGILEVSLPGPTGGNPFVDVDLRATFTGPEETRVRVGGFYDGDGVYYIRFQPPQPGHWIFRVESNSAMLDGAVGEVEIAPRSPDNHGPVQVADTFHFAHTDGTRYHPIGTTVYALSHQSEELEQQTLATLAEAPFTKVRMCVFPKSYLFNTNEPPYDPYAPDGQGGWDFSRFNPEFFRHLEQRILDLQRLGIECDLILFHAYDRWGYSQMPPWADEEYLRYLTRRLAAFRTVWWSLANEYDLLTTKPLGDWDRFAAIVCEEDPSGHLLSVHNCFTMYDHTKPWVTHCSIQRIDVYKTSENTDSWRREYGKPVIIDECGYEGDIDLGWGNLTGQDLVRRAWEAAARGGYFTHGETYVNPDEILWWSRGGELVGESPARFAFLHQIYAEAPDGKLDPRPSDWDCPCAGNDDYRLYYFGFNQPSYRTIWTPRDTSWAVDVIDTWAMTVATLPATYSGRFTVPLPGHPYIALRLRRIQ